MLVMDWTNYQEPRCCAYTALLWPKQCPFSVRRVPSMSCPPIWINWPTPSIALCRLAGAVPAYLCSAKCGIQRGGFLSTRRTVVIAALPHGRGRQGPMALCSSIFGLGRPRPRLPKCQDSVHGRPDGVGVLSMASVMSFHKARSTLPLSLWPLGQTSYQHLHWLQDKFATSKQSRILLSSHSSG